MRPDQFQLKAIAIVTMAIDHAGAVLFPEMTILRIIGRMAFPIFAFLIANGYEFTKSRKSYGLRLLAFAFISQIPFSLAFNKFDTLNVFFTLFAALMAIWAYDSLKERGMKREGLAAALSIALIPELLNADWGIFGVLLPLVFHVFKGNPKKTAAASVLLTLAFDAYMVISYSMVPGSDPARAVTFVLIHLSWFAALPIILGYSGRKGGFSSNRPMAVKIQQYFFYAFYPLHLLVLYILKSLI